MSLTRNDLSELRHARVDLDPGAPLISRSCAHERHVYCKGRSVPEVGPMRILQCLCDCHSIEAWEEANNR